MKHISDRRRITREGLCPFRGAEWIETIVKFFAHAPTIVSVPSGGQSGLKLYVDHMRATDPGLCPFRGAEWIETGQSKILCDRVESLSLPGGRVD